MKKGVYYSYRSDEIVYFSDIQHYEDLNSEFVICTWEYSKGVYPKTMITKKQFRLFKWLGSL